MALVSRGNGKLAGELLERQSEILASLYGDGTELPDGELEPSMDIPGQEDPDGESSQANSASGSEEPADGSQDAPPEGTSGDE